MTTASGSWLAFNNNTRNRVTTPPCPVSDSRADCGCADCGCADCGCADCGCADCGCADCGCAAWAACDCAGRTGAGPWPPGAALSTDHLRADPRSLDSRQGVQGWAAHSGGKPRIGQPG